MGGDGGCRVGEARAGTTSPMPDHKGLKLQELVNFQKFSTLRVNSYTRDAKADSEMRRALRTSDLHKCSTECLETLDTDQIIVGDTYTTSKNAGI